MKLREITRDVKALAALANKYPAVKLEVPSSMWELYDRGRTIEASLRSLIQLDRASQLVQYSTLTDPGLAEQLRVFNNVVSRELDKVQAQLEAEI